MGSWRLFFNFKHSKSGHSNMALNWKPELHPPVQEPINKVDAWEQLATHVPYEVLQRSPDDPIPQTVQSFGIVMFADVSGFTSLCETYCSGSKCKKSGTDQLTSTLNSYLSQIVQAILEARGDVLKFAGDAILAYWKCNSLEASAMLRHVIWKSLAMQKECDNYQTPDGVLLRMKIGLSIGKTEIHYIGNDEYRTFDITGPAVIDVNVAQELTEPGGVVISKMAWDLCKKEKYVASLVHFGFAQIINIVTRNVAIAPANSVHSQQKRLEEKLELEKQRNSERLHLALNLTDKAQKYLRSFILRTVVHKVDHGYDVNWLSELRQVSVLFINLDPDYKEDELEEKEEEEEDEELQSGRDEKLLQTSFEAIYPVLVKYDGLMNKVFMFDKGCTFLCIFGLPHAAHEDDPLRALCAAKAIFQNLKTMDDICLRHVSIGVTTGMAFCGVVGHPKRHEYTVIGQKVNMAARLMTNFPDSVSCDDSTRSKSVLPAQQFTATPPIELKGISNPEPMFYVSDETFGFFHDIHDATDAKDIIGRKKEIEIFLGELEHTTGHSRDHPGVMVISGTGGIGKTKLLKAMKAKAAEQGFRVVSGIGGLIERNTPFFTVKTLITRLLELDTCCNIHEKEQLILQHVTEDNIKMMLPLLNDLLSLKFPQTQVTQHMTHSERTQALHNLLFSIVHQEALTQPCVFGIDDATWIDHDSWSFLMDLALDPNAILLLCARPLNKVDEDSAMKQICDHSCTIVQELEGLTTEEMVKLACQMLEVDELPEQVVEIIKTRSHGVPLWCEELLETMVEMGLLQVMDDEVKENLSTTAKMPVLHSKKKKAVLKTIKHGESNEIGLGDIPIPDSLAGMVLTRIDHMSPSDQMSLKCAAIIGSHFNKSMLQAIIPKCRPDTFYASLDNLAEAGIIECAIAAEARTRIPDLHSKSLRSITTQLHHDDPHLQCPCLKTNLYKANVSGSQKHPPINECQMLQFVHAYIQETAYGLWTESQRKSLHRSAGKYLESDAHKCTNCGGGGFLTIGKQKEKSDNKGAGGRGRAFIGASNMNSTHRRRNTLVFPQADTAETTNLQDDIMSSSTDLLLETEGRNRVRFESICQTGLKIDLQDCHCDEVLAQVYPQLVYHWREAGCIDKTLHYLLEAAEAAIATFNNMEAISLLEEIEIILKEKGYNKLSKLENAALESLFGQAYFQSGEITESMPRFQRALFILDTCLPSSLPRVVINLVVQACRQFMHCRFPHRFIGSRRGLDSAKLLDKSRCMAHIAHIYHYQHKRMHTLMIALHQLNCVEEAEENIHEMIEAYAAMAECCHLLDMKSMTEYYIEKALKLCNDGQFGAEDIHTYAHLLNVALNFKLCHGKLSEAHVMGIAVNRITTRIHDTPMKLAALPLLFYTDLYQLKVQQCMKTLEELKEVAHESDDLRAQAVIDCCQFDGLLDIGLDSKESHSIVSSAETCSHEDVYHFDAIERFFLVSCVSLWYSRNRNYALSAEFISIAEDHILKYAMTGPLDLMLPKFETFLAVRALCRFVECRLLLWRDQPNDCKLKQASRTGLYTLKSLVGRFPVLSAQYLHLRAYKKRIAGKVTRSRSLLYKALAAAKTPLERLMVAQSLYHWFGIGDAPELSLDVSIYLFL